MSSVFPEDDKIVNFRIHFRQITPLPHTVSLSYESVDNEDYDELDSYIGNPTLTVLAFCETSKGGLMMLEGDFSYSKHRVTGDVTQWHYVQRSY